MPPPTPSPYVPAGPVIPADNSVSTVKLQDGAVTDVKVAGPLTPTKAQHGHTGADGMTQVAHANTTGKTANDHHAQAHIHNGADGSGTVAHAATTGQTANDHHAQIHAHNTHTGIGVNDHHNQAHALNGADHTGTTLPAGTLIPAAGAAGGRTIADHYTMALNAQRQMCSLSVEPTGIFFIIDASAGVCGIFTCDGGGHHVIVVNSSPAGYITNVAGNAGTLNIYWSAGNARYELENKQGANHEIVIVSFIY